MSKKKSVWEIFNIHEKKGRFNLLIFVLIIILLLYPIILIVLAFLQYIYRSTKKITVRSIFSPQHRIIDTDGNVYEVFNIPMMGFFRAAELFSSFEIGKTYDIHILGKRIPWANLYPSIYKAQKTFE